MEITTFREKCCSFFTALLTVVLVGGASTIYASELELNEGAPGGNILNDGNTDWEDIFDVIGNAVPTQANPLPANYTESVFIRDFVPGEAGPDISTFTTGSKDTLNITPGWECTRSNNVNDKTDIVNAYATAYIDPISSDLIVYFALERYSNEGTGNVGFWFLKDDEVGCPVMATGPKSASFTGNHVDGDTLVVAEFATGGDLDNVVIAAYEWQGGAGGFLDPNPVGGVMGSECIGDGAGQNLCGVVNKEQILMANIPWLTETKQPGNTPSNDLDEAEFFEGKINLTALGLDGCFAKYMGVTRSSTSLTATIFDYALGDFNLCSIDVVKACTVGVPPVVNAAGTKVITTFDVVVTNDGGGPVSDVAIAEKIAAGIGVCELVAIDDVATGPTSLPKDTPVTIKASLTAGESVEATVKCEGANGLVNIVQATAKSVASSTTPDLTETYTMLSQNTCPISPNPTVTLTKACDGVRLWTEPNSGVLSMLVNVDISLQNTSPQQLQNVDINNHVGGTANTGNAIPLYYADSAGNYVDGLNSSTVVDFDNRVQYPSTPTLTLNPGDTVYLRSEYNPADVDGGIASEDSPGAAMFTDTVSASGTGAINGTFGAGTSEDPLVTKTVSCPLCPPDEE